MVQKRFSIKAFVAILSAACCLACLVQLAPPDSYAATVSVNWSAPSTGHTTHRMFGSNDEMCGQFSDGALDPKYSANMARIGIRFLRLHSGVVESWTTNGAWDTKKIATELNAPYVKACGPSNIIITINDVPKWCRNGNGSINDAKYASLCAQLVTIVNKRMGRHVKYWECMNEASMWSDYANNNWPPMLTLYNDCARAMKAADPTIKVGGNVLTWYDDGLAKQWLARCWPNIDFMSWHIYMVGGNLTPPLNAPALYAQVMQKIPIRFADEIAKANATIAIARSWHPGDSHPIPLAIDEFNIPASWNQTGWGQNGYVGATFFAAVLTNIAHAHLDISTNWSAKEDNYGLTDMHDRVRLPAYVYQFANHDLIGSIVPSRSDDPDCSCLAVFAGHQAAGAKHSILVTNTSYNAKTVTLAHALAPGRVARITTIDKSGVHSSTRTIKGANTTIVMPGFSVAMIAMP